MSQQKALFEDLFPEPPEDTVEASPKPQNSKTAKQGAGLKILPSHGKTLGKAQRSFNRLVASVERLRRELARQTARLDAALVEYATRLHPLQKQEAELRKQLARSLYSRLQPRSKPALGKHQKKTLRAVVLNQLEFVANIENGLADEDLQEIHSAVSEKKYDRKMDTEEFDTVGKDLQDAFAEFGVDVDFSGVSPDMSEEDSIRFQRELFEKFQEVQTRLENDEAMSGKRNRNGQPRKKTKKQLAAEARAQAMEEARKRGIGSIYKQLARAFHPDLESDPAQRVAKEELMKELTRAYKAGDLHTLLRLELEWIHREERDAAHLTDEKLEIYNAVLREQVGELERECHLLASQPRYAPLHQFAGMLGGLHGFDAGREAERIEDIVKNLKQTLAGLAGENPASEIKHILFSWQESKRAQDKQTRMMDAVFGAAADDDDDWQPIDW